MWCGCVGELVSPVISKPVFSNDNVCAVLVFIGAHIIYYSFIP